jgi:hypothetical protein
MAEILRLGSNALVRAHIQETRSTKLVDPQEVSFVVKDPAGTTTTYVYGTDLVVAKLGVGLYELTLTPDSAGIWRVRLECGGNYLGAEEIRFYVQASTL